MSVPAYELIRSRRKTLTVTVSDVGRVLVRAPRLMPKSAIDRFLLEKADWIASRVALAEGRRRFTFESGEALPLLGGSVALILSDSVKRAAYDGVRLTLPTGTPEEVRQRVIRWYKEVAREVFSERAAYFAERMGVSPGTLRVSSADTRWGSCGKQNSLNLCFKLVMAELSIVDYVVVHELAHCRRRDHSKEFWNIVEAQLPDWKRRRKWLNDHRMELMI